MTGYGEFGPDDNTARKDEFTSDAGLFYSDLKSGLQEQFSGIHPRGTGHDAAMDAFASKLTDPMQLAIWNRLRGEADALKAEATPHIRQNTHRTSEADANRAAQTFARGNSEGGSGPRSVEAMYGPYAHRPGDPDISAFSRQPNQESRNRGPSAQDIYAGYGHPGAARRGGYEVDGHHDRGISVGGSVTRGGVTIGGHVSTHQSDGRDFRDGGGPRSVVGEDGFYRSRHEMDGRDRGFHQQNPDFAENLRGLTRFIGIQGSHEGVSRMARGLEQDSGGGFRINHVELGGPMMGRPEVAAPASGGYNPGNDAYGIASVMKIPGRD